MSRIFTALIRLAGVTLAAGLITATVLTFRVGQINNIGVIESTGQASSLTSYLVFQFTSLFDAVTFTLIAGVTLMGIVTAWAVQRRRWLIALLLTTIVSIVAPFAINAWVMFHPSLTPGLYATQNLGLSESLEFINYTAPLIPVALTLVFARSHGSEARRMADTDIAITRSPL